MKLPLTTCILRPWTTSDKDSLVKHANNPRIAANMRDLFPYPYTEKDADNWLQSLLHHSPIHLLLAIEINAEAVGGIGIHGQEGERRFNAEIGYWLAEPFWNKGILSEAVPALVNYTFSTYSFTRIFAGVYSYNPASSRVLEKSGFHLEAVHRNAIYKNGQYCDEKVYVIHKSPSI